MSRKPYTSGPLNKLNGDAGISAPEKSVSVSGLIRAHRPKSADELETLIREHTEGKCPCGMVSQGTVQDFGRNLYEAQLTYWGKYRFSLQECIQWEYDLFILQMLKGRKMEDECRIELSERLGDRFAVRDTNAYVDENLRVDLEVLADGKVIAGIQVKPASFDRMRPGVKMFNKEANSKYVAPVIYVAYDYESEGFLDIDSAVDHIAGLVQPDSDA